MNAIFLAEEREDGTPGKPIGNEQGAIMVFEDGEMARTVWNELRETIPTLAMFGASISVVGKIPE